ncbi:MAG: excinuclease ABC subunit UvrB [Candidatus Krumholzibacteria bacterium]|nr:excinuclease ABC subunit UvrB [Candidatus Krumholzibacteria bacterium]
MGLFKLHAPFRPTGDQPEAIRQLVAGVRRGKRWQTLLGVTGSGKTFTMANVIAEIERPTLIFSHNKTLAAQLYGELKGFFPDNAVEYFISYYDYYQPEAFIPQTNTYIEKDTSINEEIERLRLRTTSSLLARRDVVVVCSVSAIYGLGNPRTFREGIVHLQRGQRLDREDLLQLLIDAAYERRDATPDYGSFRVRGDVVEVRAAHEERTLRVEFFGDEIERLTWIDQLSGRPLEDVSAAAVFPASQFIIDRARSRTIVAQIEQDLQARLAEFAAAGRPLEAQRLESRTRYDMEMIRQIGHCPGVENYSRYFDQRRPGERPACLLDYFPADFLLFIDESHATVPQIGAMYNGDRSRKLQLVEHGFRLPSALDNRPLVFAEFTALMPATVFVSATPGDWELAQSEGEVVEQVIRPTGLVDPALEIMPVANQVDDLLARCREVTARGERVLVTTLTKKMSEDLTEYLSRAGLRVAYLHSDIAALDRIEILRQLRLGESEVLVGVNLLREGLDLPEVSLVAILDADREGFLRSARSLIQTAGRAARNLNGRVVMYADRLTDSMRQACEEMERRRQKQLAYNRQHGITPRTITKSRAEIMQQTAAAGTRQEAAPAARPWTAILARDLSPRTVLGLLNEEMDRAAAELRFEEAAQIRDRIEDLKTTWGIGGESDEEGP